MAITNTTNLPALNKLVLTTDMVSSGRVYRIQGESNAEDLQEIAVSSTLELGPFPEARQYAIVSDKGQIQIKIELTVGGGITEVEQDLAPALGGDLNLNGRRFDFPTVADIDDCINDDTFATATDTSLATSDSIKNYVDTQVAGVSGGDLELIASVVPVVETSVDFTGLDSTDYDTYLLVFTDIYPTNASERAAIRFRQQGQGSFDTTASYQYMNHYTDTLGVDGNDVSPGSSRIRLSGTGVRNNITDALSGHLWIFDPANGTAKTKITGSSTHIEQDGLTQIATRIGGTYSNTNVVDAVQVIFEASTVRGKNIALYGLRT